MTHLKIEQNNGITEQVSPSVIEKLYEIVHSGNLDSSSNLMGSLNTTGTYLDYVDYLEELFTKNGVRLLVITANKLYLSFEDPEVLRILSTTYGDGNGVTLSELLNVSNIPNVFKGNTTILTFNEFLYFTGITHRNISNTDDWFNGCTNLREITIPKNIESLLPNTMFNSCTSLETINFALDCCITTLPSFAGCSSLSSITIPDSVTAISSFQLTALTTIDTNNVTTLPNGIFKGVSSLTSANLPNVTSIGGEIFVNCTGLTTVVWDNLKITSINDSAFANCTNLVINDLNLPNLTTLRGLAFGGTKVKQISNLGSITSIDAWTFSRCPLTSVTLPNTLTSIGEAAFYECTSLPSINLNNVTSLAARTFWGCSSLTSIDLSNCTSLDHSVFRGCTSLSSVTMNSNVTTLPIAFFAECTSLTQVPFNSLNITSIGGDLFYGCSNIGRNTTLELNLTALTTYPSNAFNGTKFKRLILHYPDLTSTNVDTRYIYAQSMSELEYLDLSDTGRWTTISNSVTFTCPFDLYNMPSILTAIAPLYCDYLSIGAFIVGSSKKLIILNTTPPRFLMNDKNHSPYYFFNNLNMVYVPDSALLTYLTDSDWLLLGDGTLNFDLSTRVKGLSELPAGVWTTGLASQYLTPALLATS